MKIDFAYKSGYVELSLMTGEGVHVLVLLNVINALEVSKGLMEAAKAAAKEGKAGILEPIKKNGRSSDIVPFPPPAAHS